MRVAMCALVVALVFGAGSARAAGNAGDVELGGYAGYGWLDDYAPIFPKNDLLYGARLGVFFTRDWSFEVSAQRIKSEIEGIDDSDVNLDALRGNLLYNFPTGGMVRPFITGGVGWEKFDPESPDIFDEFVSKTFGWNVGAGLRLNFTDAVGLRIDGRYVDSNPDEFDEKEGNVEANAGLSFYFGGHGNNEYESSELTSTNSAPTVSCSSDQTEVMPGATATITATASDPDGDPLTYEWTTSAGRVIGTGNAVTLDFGGVTGPTPASVTVRVSDGHGHSATCSADVRLAAAPPPPPPATAEAISCLSGGFSRNAARLTNVDKACLDDVVQRLRNDPRAHVVVIGHADTRETSGTIAQRRADAVKDYFTAAGIETARINTRSAGSGHPVAMGTDTASLAQNRRVEVWFVPEGAPEPSEP